MKQLIGKQTSMKEQMSNKQLDLDTIAGIESLSDINAEATVGGALSLISQTSGGTLKRSGPDGTSLVVNPTTRSPQYAVRNDNRSGRTRFVATYFQPDGEIAAIESTRPVMPGRRINLARYDGNQRVDGRRVTRIEIEQLEVGNDVLLEIEDAKKKIASGGTQVGGRDLVELWRLS